MTGPPASFVRSARASFLTELGPGGTPPTDEALAEARERLADWQLASELSPAELEAALAAQGWSVGTLTDAIAARVEPDHELAWHPTLRAALDRIGGDDARAPLPASPEDPPFAEVLDAFVAVGWEALRAAAPPASPVRVDWAAIARQLVPHLRTLLLQLCQRTLVLELNVARLEGWLSGDTPAARYACYAEALRREPSRWVALFDEYQVLARLMSEAITRWVAAIAELLGHLARDHGRLVDPAASGTGHALLPGGALRLVSLVGGISDPHRGGRGVWKLRFELDRDQPAPSAEPAPPRSTVCVMYKPRSLAVDRHTQALLARCNAAAAAGALSLAGLRHTAPRAEPFPALRTLGVLDCGDHGWTEHVEAQGCADRGAAARFYVRQGAYLALLDALDGADVHYENVIASGEHPMLVDLETLFHPWIPLGPDEGAGDARSRAQAALRASVLRTALLPGLTWGDRERTGVNIGGLGDGRTQLSPRATLWWSNAGTDAMHAEPRRMTVAPGANVPRVDGEVVAALPHVEDVVAGFEAMWRFLTDARDELLAPGGAVAAFADAPTRRLLRPTSAYAHLVEAGGHPDHLRDAMDREQLLDLLWKVSAGKPPLWAVVAREKADLRQGDIPCFASRPGARDLWDSRGERLPEVLAATPLAQVAARLAARGPRELDAQVFVLRGALSAMSVASARVVHAAAPLAARGGRGPFDAALAIGDQLAATAIEGDRDATWLGMEGSRDRVAVELSVVGGGLYGGTGGIALFLAHLGRLAREPRYTQLAERAAWATRGALDRDDVRGDPGGFSGSLSQLYVLTHLAALWRSPALVPPLEGVLARAERELAGAARHDIIDGAAGSALAALAIHELTGAPRALAVAAEAARALVRGAVSEGRTASWPCSVSARHLLGFSHGVAGVGAALHRVARVAARHRELALDPELLAALAEAAFDYERARFVPGAGNWPDLREEVARDDGAPRFMIGYCHGAPGVALARLAAPDLSPGTTARREIEIAVATTLGARVQPGQTLCHGELGNLMIVQRAAEVLGRDDWRAEVARRLAITVARLFDGGLDCGYDFAPAAPALMDGIAGIGYGLLALSAPGELPFVLDLSPPVVAERPS